MFFSSEYSKIEVEISQKAFEKELTTQRRLIVFLEDGARPDYLFLNSSVPHWKPFFQSLLKSDPTHAMCSTMKVDPPTSTTQGVKTLLTGGMRSFLELGQTFFSSSLTSDHWLRQLRTYRNLSIVHTGDHVWRELGGDVFSNDPPESDSFDVYVDDTDDIQEALEAFVESSTDVLMFILFLWIIMLIEQAPLLHLILLFMMLFSSSINISPSLPHTFQTIHFS